MRPILCEDCFRFDKFGKECKYFWDRKKDCGSKVKSFEEMIDLDKIRNEK